MEVLLAAHFDRRVQRFDGLSLSFLSILQVNDGFCNGKRSSIL